MSTIKELDALLKAKYPNIILSRYKTKAEKLAALNGQLAIVQSDKPRAPRGTKTAAVQQVFGAAAVPMQGVPVSVPVKSDAKSKSKSKKTSGAAVAVDPKMDAFNRLKADLIAGPAQELAMAGVIYNNAAGQQVQSQQFQVTIYRVGYDGSISIRVMSEGKYDAASIPVGSEHELALDVNTGYLTPNNTYDFSWVKVIPGENAAVVIPVSQLLSRTQDQLALQRKVLSEQKAIVEQNLAAAPFVATRDLSFANKERVNTMYKTAQDFIEVLKRVYDAENAETTANFLKALEKVNAEIIQPFVSSN
jgi:hypothetical protein